MTILDPRGYCDLARRRVTDRPIPVREAFTFSPLTVAFLENRFETLFFSYDIKEKFDELGREIFSTPRGLSESRETPHRTKGEHPHRTLPETNSPSK